MKRNRTLTARRFAKHLEKRANGKFETLYAAYMDDDSKVIDIAFIKRGGTKQVRFNPYAIVDEGLRVKAKRVMMAHNHPNGDSRESSNDRHAHMTMHYLFKEKGIKLEDSLIVAKDGWYSTTKKQKKPWKRNK